MALIVTPVSQVILKYQLLNAHPAVAIARLANQRPSVQSARMVTT